MKDGDAYATTVRAIDSSDSNPIVVKSGVYPYNYLTQPQASELSRNMYLNDKFESDLINSYAYDTTIVFIQMFSGDTDYSMQNIQQKELEKCGESIIGDDCDARCNIYDMAGNVREWTTEYRNDWAPCVSRGRDFDDESTRNVIVRIGNAADDNSGYTLAPRIIIYL